MVARFTHCLSTAAFLPAILYFADRCKPWCRCRFAIFNLSVFLLPVDSVDAQSVSRITILERGIYQAETVSQTPASGTTGIINTVQNPRLISSTPTVIGQVGVRFGLRYLLLGAKPGSKKALRLVIVFPPAGLRTPQTGQVHFQNEHEVSVPVGVVQYWEYHFENQWEIAEGIWQFEFWDGTRKLGQQRFCVHRLESQAPTLRLARECREHFLG